MIKLRRFYKRVARHVIVLTMSVKDYKHMVKRADIEPDKKRKLFDYVRNFCPNKSIIYYKSNIEMIKQLAIWIRHPDTFKYKIMGRNED